MSATPQKTDEMVNVQLDGQWIQVPKGINAVDAAERFGKFIPHYCYHPKLQVVGNCRMCLIELGMPKMGPDRQPVMGPDGRPEIAWMPRPQIGCATTVSEGMGIRTDSPLAQECRKGVMEFLLANHPLDCPICDQAGECKLQEFSVQYGQAASRFVEEKVKKPKRVDLGERILLDDERCILCSRCIRFTRDVAQDDCLGFVQRGSLSYLTAHPGKGLDNNYSLNTVDLCPVGALTSKDFRFQMRVWFLKETKSICTSCGTGCNTTIGSREGSIYRQTPRDNEEVNQCWMCDHGRLNFHYLHDPARLHRPAVRTAAGVVPTDWNDAIAQLAAKLKSCSPQQLVIVASARMTNEELFLTRLLHKQLGGDAVLMDTVQRPQKADHLLVSADGNPNSTGAKLFGVSSDGIHSSRIVHGINNGSYQVVLALHEDLVPMGAKAEALARIPGLACLSMLPTQTTDAATYVLPGSGFAEKRGTMINVKRRIQRLNKAVPAPEGARDDWEILAALLAAVGGAKFASFEEVFKAMVAATPCLQGLTLAKIGDMGVQLR